MRRRILRLDFGNGSSKFFPIDPAIPTDTALGAVISKIRLPAGCKKLDVAIRSETPHLVCAEGRYVAAHEA